MQSQAPFGLQCRLAPLNVPFLHIGFNIIGLVWPPSNLLCVPQAADEEWLDGLLSSKLEVILKPVRHSRSICRFFLLI